MARGVGYLVSLVGLRVLKGASLAREEAEDMWAEAQSMRRERRGAETERESDEGVARAAARRASKPPRRPAARPRSWTWICGIRAPGRTAGSPWKT